MNKELRELKAKIDEMKNEARTLVKTDVEKAENMVNEIKNLQKQFDLELALFEEEKENVKNMKKPQKDVKNIEVEAFKNAILGKPLTEDMQNALTTSTGVDGGYLVPDELVEQIEELRREHVSLKPLVHNIEVTSAKGSMPIEDAANFTKLVDFDEVTDLAQIDLKFNNVNFVIKNKGGIVPMSNSLVADEKAGLPSYVTRTFAKKAVKTENDDILTILTAGSAKTFTNIKDVKKSYNKDLDPGIKGDGFVFIMNSDAYGMLDDEVDGNGRPLLQPNPTQANQKTLFGHPVVVLSTTELPTKTNKAPIIFGNLQGAIAFFDRKQYEVAASTEFLFGRNQTALRVIERYDVKEQDKTAYVYGTIDVAAYLA